MISPLTWLALAVTAALTLLLLRQLGVLHSWVRDDVFPDAAERRRVTSRTMRLVGAWQISLGVCSLSMGSATSAFTLIPVGAAIIGMDWVGRRVNSRLGP